MWKRRKLRDEVISCGVSFCKIPMSTIKEMKQNRVKIVLMCEQREN